MSGSAPSAQEEGFKDTIKVFQSFQKSSCKQNCFGLWGAAHKLNEAGAGAELGLVSALQPFSVSPVCSLLTEGVL